MARSMRIERVTIRSLLVATIALLAFACTLPSGGRHERQQGAARELLALIPEDVKPCVEEYEESPFVGGFTHVATAGHPAAVAGVFCSWEPPTAPQDKAGSVWLTYLLFPTADAMDADYWGHWVWGGRHGTNCATQASSEFMYLVDGRGAGHLFCTAAEFQPKITWTDDRHLVLAHAMQIPFPDIGAPELLEWWLGRFTGQVDLRVGAAGEQCLGRTADIVGSPQNDVLRGTPGEDIILGLGGDDVIRGLGAKDRICGGPGDDRLMGGRGNDLLSGGTGDDSLDGGGQVFDLVSYIDAPGPVRVDLAAGTALGEGMDALAGVDDAQGSNFNDVLVGDAGWNDIEGLGGDDVIVGGDGGDFLEGGPGNDRIQGDDGNDYLYGHEGHDRLDGGPGRDHLYNYWSGTDECLAGEVVRCGPS
ncbi:MAG: calcium-binding protein [Actinomycetota bacterium]